MPKFDTEVGLLGHYFRIILGSARHPGSTLNELVAFEAKYNSLFAVGAVLSSIPRQLELTSFS
jgi:hypothetical protein